MNKKPGPLLALFLLFLMAVPQAAAESKPLCHLTHTSYLPFSRGLSNGPPSASEQTTLPDLQADFNGDGCADFAVGAPHQQWGSAYDAGSVHIFYGYGGGNALFRDDQIWSENSAGMPGSASGYSRFGHALAAGDFDGDGYTDLATGAPGKTISGQSKSGEVTILYGSHSGLSASRAQAWNQDTPGVPGGSENGDYFAAALDAADFNGDGFTDLAIGVPYEDIESKNAVDAGAVVILYGSTAGLTAGKAQSWTQDSAGMPGAVESGDNFGYSLAAGDFNNDKRFDLAIGAPFEDVSSNRVVNGGWIGVIYGTGEGLSTYRTQWFTQDAPGIPGVSEKNDLFGWSLAAGRFDDDGRYDLAVGVPLEDINSNSIINGGYVNIFYGSGGGLFWERASSFSLSSPGVPGTAHDELNFGDALSVGDFNGDQHFDLLVGAEGWDDLSGAAFILYGSKDGITGSGSQGFQPPNSAPNAIVRKGDRLGKAVTAGDYDADGYWDMVAGLPGREPTGGMLLMPGSPQGVDNTRLQLIILLQEGRGNPSSQFGLSMR